MAKISIVEKKQVVVLKKEIYVEGTKEEVEEWLKTNRFNDGSDGSSGRGRVQFPEIHSQTRSLQPGTGQ